MSKTRITWIIFIDLIILFLAFFIVAAFKPSTSSYLSIRYISGLGIFLLLWLISSIYFKKYNFQKDVKLEKIVQRIVVANLFAVSFLAVFIIVFSITGYSRTMFFGTAGVASVLEILIGNLYFLVIHTKNGHTDIYNPPPKAVDLKRAGQAIDYRDISLDEDFVKQAIIEERGQEVFDFFEKHIDVQGNRILCVATTTRFNIEFQPSDYFRKIINLKRINDIQYINKFFETVNRRLPKDGLFMGFAETKEQRKKRIMKKYPPIINGVFYSFDFILKRVFPKFILTKKIYFLLTRGQSRVLSRAEVLGRLYSCGFEELDEKDINGYYYFVMKKKSSPAYDLNPTYGPFVKLNRVGKNGKMIKVFKFRTMHPYAEYLQDYVFKKNHLAEGGKFKNDFRVTSLGRLMRKLWIDELPMFINLIKGEMKIVGVRPISKHYYNLYTEELKEKRILSKPGLIPPFYADIPKTLEEIQESELRYLEAHEKNPLLTDWVYFWKAIYNILFRRARSN